MFKEPTVDELAENVGNPLFGDDRLGVMFYTRLIPDDAETLAQGRKVFKEVEFIKIMVPGDRQNIVERPVQRTGRMPTDDIMRFSRQYERFKQHGANAVAHSGTPLTLWPALPAVLAEELKYINVFTVEQLADIADAYASKIPQGYQWKKKAQDFVTALKDQSAVNKLQLELADRDSKIAALEQSVKEQAKAIEALSKRVK